ncbi:hypothetical protein F5883DRAFT_627027 [Diaporthe sp. PMI_573]|nr:hypothetical protein F5883DRAFT_627027 [Diaporthaceae sp. PMI_573]
MDVLAQLDDYSKQLAAAVKRLSDQHGTMDSSDADAGKGIDRDKASILANVARIQMLVSAPSDFLEHLASQVELLGCIHWLGNFQILPCIPLETKVPVKDVADLARVPEIELARVIRLTSIFGFLSEPQPGIVAHTPLSAHFVTQPSLLDAAIFLAELSAPTALQMASATQRLVNSGQPTDISAYSLAQNTTTTFYTACQERPRLSRQWSAYLHHAAGLRRVGELADVLSQLSWSNLTNACIVDVDARSTSLARHLADLHPGLRLIVQINKAASARPSLDLFAPSGAAGAWGLPTPATAQRARDTDPGSRITVTHRTPGAPQDVTDADVYILHLPATSSAGPMLSQLQELFGILRAGGGRGMMLILTALLLPELGSTSDPRVEAVARTRDLGVLRLAGEGEMEMADLLGMIATIRDGVGRLTITDRIRSSDGVVVALAVKYQVYTESPLEF